jgi:ferredoxin
MDKQLKSQVVFHLTGRHAEGGKASDAVRGMRPALMAPYRRLDHLRYDFPVVLATDGATPVRSLTSVLDTALRAVAPPGVEGEALRRRTLQIEREIRRLVAGGGGGTLTELWDRAAMTLVPKGDVAFLTDALKVRGAFEVDGAVADCDAALPARFMRHTWSVVQAGKCRRARERIGNLEVRLDDILRADRARSHAALEQPALQATFGGAHHGLFDFGSMARLLSSAGPRGGLSERRRRRVEGALADLRSQRFFPPAGEEAGAFEFEFATADAAMAAFRERLPELARVLKALQVAELEVGGDYVEAVHDALFDEFGAQSVTPTDLEFFPDYLVCLEAGQSGTQGSLAEALSSGAPVKVAVHVNDVTEVANLGQAQFAFGMRGAQLASAALSYDDVFVLQTAASNLLQLRERVERGLRHAGPALFAIYAPPDGGTLPGYLQAAAAMQSRAFPAFSYDPGAGADLASRFSLENNPQPELDWPVDRLQYADPDLQAASEDVAFTFADFALCDPRCADHFDPVPRASWGEGMLTAQEWMARPAREASLGVPYVLAVDEADLLTRLVVDEPLMRAGLRCCEAWHRLQGLAGIHDSRTERRLARERQAWEEAHQRELAAAAAAVPHGLAESPVAASAAPAAPAAAVAPAATTASAEPEPARNPDEAYIETIRCSTCNECTQVNPRMFAYNENKQAYIVDLKAGTYKQLVEAAESCQVSIIHPGKPWDPGEPGLEELMERAKPFF